MLYSLYVCQELVNKLFFYHGKDSVLAFYPLFHLQWYSLYFNQNKSPEATLQLPSNLYKATALSQARRFSLQWFNDKFAFRDS